MNMKKLLSLLLVLVATFCWSQEKTVPKDVIYYTNAPSKKELFSRARDVLKKSLENKDFGQAGEAYAYLQANVAEGAPLTVFEEYLIDMEMGHYEDGVRKFAGLRRVLFDTTVALKMDDRVMENDVLHKYLYGKFDKFTEQKADSMVNLVDASGVGTGLKNLYAALIYAELSIGIEVFSNRTTHYLQFSLADTTRAGEFLDRAHKFIDDNPYSEHTNYLQNQIVPMVEKRLQNMRKYGNDPFARKYYSGGIGAFVGGGVHFFAGDVNDYLETKEHTSIWYELSLQFFRVSFNLFTSEGGLTVPLEDDREDKEPHDKDITMGLSTGYTVYDSRFLRIEPFVGLGSYDFESGASTTFLMGANTDIRFFATKPVTAFQFSLAFFVRLKYMAMFGTYSDEVYRRLYGYQQIEASFVSHHFSASLGIILW